MMIDQIIKEEILNQLPKLYFENSFMFKDFVTCERMFFCKFWILKKVLTTPNNKVHLLFILNIGCSSRTQDWIFRCQIKA